MKSLIAAEPMLCFESELLGNSFDTALLDEKIRHDQRTAATLQRWLVEGVDLATLGRTLPTPPPPPDGLTVRRQFVAAANPGAATALPAHQLWLLWGE